MDIFEINESGVLVKYNGVERDVKIPDNIVAIGDDAFAKNYKIRTVTFSPSVKSIGRDAFKSCGFLSSVILNEGLVNIDERAFYYCDSLKTVKFPSSLKKIDESAFYKCAFDEVNIPCVTRICSYAFESCDNLRTIRLGEGCKEIASYAFPLIEYHGLNIYLPDSLKKIEKFAFGEGGYYRYGFHYYFSPQSKVVLDFVRNDYAIVRWTYTPSPSQVNNFITQEVEKLKLAYSKKRNKLANNLIPTQTNFMEDYKRRLSDLDAQINEQSDIIRNTKGIFAGGKIKKAKKLREELMSERNSLQSYARQDERKLEKYKSELKKIDSMSDADYEKMAQKNAIANLTKKQEEQGNCVSYSHACGAGTGTVVSFSNSTSSSNTSSSTLPIDDAYGRPAGTGLPPVDGEGI